MKIQYGENDEATRYFDMNDEEIHEGDCVLLDGRKERVYLTSDGKLGIDATNPIWIAKGKAYRCEYGIYPFSRFDEPVLIKTVKEDETNGI